MDSAGHTGQILSLQSELVDAQSDYNAAARKVSNGNIAAMSVLAEMSARLGDIKGNIQQVEKEASVASKEDQKQKELDQRKQLEEAEKQETAKEAKSPVFAQISKKVEEKQEDLHFLDAIDEAASGTKQSDAD